jgi:hypothetical protein
MQNKLTTIDRAHLTAACGGTVIQSPWAKLHTDMKGWIDSQMAAARARFDHFKPTAPTPPTPPTIPPIASTYFPPARSHKI